MKMNFSKIKTYCTTLYYSIRRWTGCSPQAIVLIGPLAVGDYYFHEPFLRLIKKSKQFRKTHLIYICLDTVQQILVKQPHSFDKIYSLGLLHHKHNRYKFRRYLSRYKVNLVVNLRYLPQDHRNYSLPYEKFIASIPAKHKILSVLIGQVTDPFLLSTYDQIIYSDNTLDFESVRIRKFYEKWLGSTLPNLTYKQAVFAASPLPPQHNAFLAISVLAGNPKRMYSMDKWLQICQHVLDTTHLTICFLGSSKAQEVNDEIISHLSAPTRCINLAGQTTLLSVGSVLKHAKALLSVETSTVHLAHSLQVPTVCICNGESYQRFQPYSDINYVYPPYFLERTRSDAAYRKFLYLGNADRDINEISPQQVIEKLEQLLK